VHQMRQTREQMYAFIVLTRHDLIFTHYDR